MHTKYLVKSFLNYCQSNNFEKNKNQIQLVKNLSNFVKSKKSFLNFFFKKKEKLCFYLYGDVGVGKTMIIDYVLNQFNLPKKRYHFNEFMINFHNYRHSNEKKSIMNFVKNLKKDTEVLYLDEFQVTNIVDAMILGKLFETIFIENIKVIMSTNTKVDDLYKDGLQRDQFKPFLEILKRNSLQEQLIISDDYRKVGNDKLKMHFYPLNDKTKFKLNQLFRKLTKNKKHEIKNIFTKGRQFKISKFYDGIARFDFKELCDVNIGAEDYINISKVCNLILIENIPNFTDDNINQQQRFIILIDILYEKNISLIISSETSIKNFNSSKKLVSTFKRTLSRIFELTA